MKVSYTACDICKRKMPNNEDKYRYTTIVREIVEDRFREQKLDICNDCFYEMQRWIVERFKEKEEPNDRPSS